jgi:hypothetical protein
LKNFQKNLNSDLLEEDPLQYSQLRFRNILEKSNFCSDMNSYFEKFIYFLNFFLSFNI